MPGHRIEVKFTVFRQYFQFGDMVAEDFVPLQGFPVGGQREVERRKQGNCESDAKVSVAPVLGVKLDIGLKRLFVDFGAKNQSVKRGGGSCFKGIRWRTIKGQWGIFKHSNRVVFSKPCLIGRLVLSKDIERFLKTKTILFH